jgi:hypothetical protein
MAPSHIQQYRIRIAREDGTEELTGWMDSEEQLVQTMATLRTVPGKAHWLQVRSVTCSDEPDMGRQIIGESPIAGVPSTQYSRNSRYRLAGETRNR